MPTPVPVGPPPGSSPWPVPAPTPGQPAMAPGPAVALVRAEALAQQTLLASTQHLDVMQLQSELIAAGTPVAAISATPQYQALIQAQNQAMQAARVAGANALASAYQSAGLIEPPNPAPRRARNRLAAATNAATPPFMSTAPRP